jgi:hypothetical protein
MTIKAVGHSTAKITEKIINILEHVEKIPWYWVSLFTSMALLIISIFVKNVIPYSNIVDYGGEYGNVGMALAQGRGFSDPFSINSGATAWVSPLLPVIIGIIFYITGLKITTTFWILHLIKIISLGLGVGLIWAVMQKSIRGFASVCYLWMGFLFYIHNSELLDVFHDQWLIFLIISLAFWAWYKRASFSGQVVLIIAFAAAAFCNLILWLALLIVMLIFNGKDIKHSSEFYKDRLKNKFFARNSFWIAVSISLVLITGWTVRNWIQLEMFAPIKSNAGYEIFQTQLVSKKGLLSTSTFINHPYNPASKESQAYAALGETAFVNARRDMAINSILADPSDFCRRVAERFKNTFLFTISPFNFDDVDPRICIDDLERLRDAGLIGYFFNRKVWIYLDNPRQNVLNILPSLHLSNQPLVESNWRLTWARYSQYLFSWDRIIGGCFMSGIPWIALLIAILMRRRSKLSPCVWWAGIFLLLYLMPYVLISHYLRYQVPLLGMQAILLTAGTIAILRTLDYS